VQIRYLDIDVEDVLGPRGIAATVHRDWESRPDQLHMAEAVARRLESGGVLAVEAPTGVGKTLAYLVPAVLSGQRVIVSTHTKNLQEQIADKDMPLLEEVFASAGLRLRRADAEGETAPSDMERRHALMKGRSNYLCLERLTRQGRQRRFGFADDAEAREDIAAWAGETEIGDKAELSWLADHDPRWAELDARAEICVGSKCPQYEECFVVRMRRRASGAEVIVVNHHLLMADLALRAQALLTGDGRRFGEVIPRGDALIIDEAHGIEEIASEYFGGQMSRRKLDRWGKDAAAWAAERHDRDEIEGRLINAVASAEAVFDALPSTDGSRAPIGGDERWAPARAAMPEAVEALSAFADRVSAVVVDSDAIGGSVADRAATMAETLRFVLTADDPDFVFWASKKRKECSLGASPIEVADVLAQHLFASFRSVVLTSATLTTSRGAGFDFYLGRVGAPVGTETLELGSPFDYRQQAALYLPGELPLPDAPQFPDAIADVGADLIERVGGGAFFLFTSHRMMTAVHERLEGRLDFPMLLQGTAPKRTLIADFIEMAPAVLFATASFWEGVDVPGDPLRLVIIDKLPFASPADPLVAARTARIESRGGRAFGVYQLPQAILRLKQGFGRLIRTRTDVGVVALLDRRLRTKSYGRRFLAALPPARQLRHAPQLTDWLAERDRAPLE